MGATEIRVASISELDEGSRFRLTLGTTDVIVFRHNGQTFAYENRCRHQGGPVAEGVINGKVQVILGEDGSVLGETFSQDEIHLVCPWHGWEYNLQTGQCIANPRLSIHRLTTLERNGDVFLENPSL